MTLNRCDDYSNKEISHLDCEARLLSANEAGKLPELKEELRKWVSKEIGSLARPDEIRFTEILPKTRSGKIMRRLLREIASGGEVKGDVTTLEDFSVLARLKEED